MSDFSHVECLPGGEASVAIRAASASSVYPSPSNWAAAQWRLDQYRKTVREGEEELRRRRAALEQAEIAFAEVNGGLYNADPA